MAKPLDIAIRRSNLSKKTLDGRYQNVQQRCTMTKRKFLTIPITETERRRYLREALREKADGRRRGRPNLATWARGLLNEHVGLGAKHEAEQAA